MEIILFPLLGIPGGQIQSSGQEMASDQIFFLTFRIFWNYAVFVNGWLTN